mgnify:CR=1 FL=1
MALWGRPTLTPTWPCLPPPPPPPEQARARLPHTRGAHQQSPPPRQPLSPSSVPPLPPPLGVYPFAGREVARAFAMLSTELSDCHDDLEGLAHIELENLREWEEKFNWKVRRAGRARARAGRRARARARARLGAGAAAEAGPAVRRPWGAPVAAACPDRSNSLARP